MERHLSCQHFGSDDLSKKENFFCNFFFLLLFKKVEIDDGLITESKKGGCVCQVQGSH